jgi:hypothetical protein
MKDINISDCHNLDPNDYYYSNLINLEDLPENRPVEIKASQPIQISINGGPWQDVRGADNV